MKNNNVTKSAKRMTSSSQAKIGTDSSCSSYHVKHVHPSGSQTAAVRKEKAGQGKRKSLEVVGAPVNQIDLSATLDVLK